MAEIRIERVSKPCRNTEDGLNGVSLHVQEGELLTLAACRENGVSALLRMIAGLETIPEGTISIGGRVINAVPPKEREVAFLCRRYALYPHLTVYRNIAFGLRQRGLKPDETDRRVREAAQILEIEELLDRKPASLSGGQRLRTALGRLLARRPSVFLLDAPFQDLDADLRAEMRRELSAWRARLRITTLWATRDPAEAALGDRVAVFRDGSVERVSNPKSLNQEAGSPFALDICDNAPPTGAGRKKTAALKKNNGKDHGTPLFEA